MRRIAAVTIGAAPRPDLTDGLRAAIDDAGVGEIVVLEVGALDDLPDGVSPPPPGPGSYPLTTRRRDGRLIVAEEAWLSPRVAAAVQRAGSAGVELTLLLCAGGFASVRATAPLIRPFDVAVARLLELGARRLGVVVPIDGQVEPSRGRWTAAGFIADVMAGSPGDVGRFGGSDRTSGAVDAIVLDFVGHPPPAVAAAAAIADGTPVVDLLAVSIEAVVATMRR